MPARPTSIKRPLKAKSAVELHSVAQDGKPTPQPRHKEGNAGEWGGGGLSKVLSLNGGICILYITKLISLWNKYSTLYSYSLHIVLLRLMNYSAMYKLVLYLRLIHHLS